MPIKLSDYPEILEFLDTEMVAHLATLMSDGSPQASPVALDRFGEQISLNAASGTLKIRNMKRDRRVALSIHAPDPDTGFHSYMMLRGRVADFLEGEAGRESVNRVKAKVARLTGVDAGLPAQVVAPGGGVAEDVAAAEAVLNEEPRVGFLIDIEHIHHFLLPSRGGQGQLVSITEHGMKTKALNDIERHKLWEKGAKISGDASVPSHQPAESKKGIRLTDYPDVVDFIDVQMLAHLATLMKDGSPQISPLGLDRDGDCLAINCAAGTLKVRNIARDPRVALSIHAPDAASGFHSYMMFRGQVAQTIDGPAGQQHLYKLMSKAARLTGRLPDKIPDNVESEDAAEIFAQMKSAGEADGTQEQAQDILPPDEPRVGFLIAVDHIHHFLMNGRGVLVSINEQGARSSALTDVARHTLWERA